MEFSEVVRRRRMVRDFDARPIPSEIMERIIASTQRGPSSGFTQGFEFIVFEGAEQTQKFWQAMPWWDADDDFDGARHAPVIMIPLAHEAAYVARYLSPDKAHVGRKSGADFPSPYWFIDTAFAAMLVLLTAVDENLGGFYFSIGPTRTQIDPFRQALNIPDTHYPIGAIAIGYPGADHKPQHPDLQKRRKPIEHLIHRGGW